MSGYYDFKLAATAVLMALGISMSATAAEKAGMYLGASSANGLGCAPGSAPDPVRGLTVGCTYQDLQKLGSMGRQIATIPPDLNINFVWQNKDNNTAFLGRTIRYEAYDPALGALGDNTGGVDIIARLIPCPECPEESPTVDAVLDGTASLAFDLNNHGFNFPGSRSKPYVAKNQTPTLGDFVTREVDTLMGDTILTGNATVFRWPKVAFSGNGATGVSHVVITSDRTDGANPGLYTRRVQGGSWEPGPSFGETGYNQSFVVTASRQSDRVAIAWSGGRGNGTEFGASVSRYNGQLSGKNDNDIYVIISEDAGVTWGATQNVTQRANADPGGWAPHAKLSILFNQADSLHVVWQAVEWVGYDAEFNTRSRMFHWSENTNTVRTAVDANWDPILCNGGDNTLNLDNPQLSACNNKLYLTYTQFAPVPLGRGDDCSERALAGDSLGAANGDIYLSVSADGGLTWDAPRNLTNTYTPQCDTLPLSPLPDCDSDVWHSVTRYGIDITGFDFNDLTDLTENLDASYTDADFLVAMYINDSDPGAAIQSEGGWTDNMVKTVRFGCVEPIPSSILASSLPESSVLEIPEIFIPSSDTTFTWILENIGSQAITGLTVTPTNQTPPGAFSFSGFAPAIASGAANADTALITLNASTLPEGAGSIDFVVNGSFVGAPKTISLSYTLTNPACCQLAGDANDDGRVNIADITFLIARTFAGGPPPPCCAQANANGDALGKISIADISLLIARIFAGGAAPICGPDGIGCGS